MHTISCLVRAGKSCTRHMHRCCLVILIYFELNNESVNEAQQLDLRLKTKSNEIYLTIVKNFLNTVLRTFYNEQKSAFRHFLTFFSSVARGYPVMLLQPTTPLCTSTFRNKEIKENIIIFIFTRHV
jgi:hypothetical protein